MSENGLFWFNLHSTRATLGTIWNESRWRVTGVSSATMQEDGNFVIRRHSGNHWQSNTAGNPGAWLKLRDDGNLVVMQPDGSGTLWDSKTGLVFGNPAKELARRVFIWKLNWPGTLGPTDWLYESIDIDIQYVDPNITNTVLDILGSASYDNCADSQVTRQFTRSKQTADSYNWSNTITWHVGVTTKIKVGIPLIGGGESSLQVDYTTASQEGGTHQDTESRVVNDTIVVPAHSHLDVEWTLFNNIYSAKYTSLTTVVGAVLGQQMIQENSTQHIEVRVDDHLSPHEQILFGSGVFHGIKGFRDEVVVRQSPEICT